MTNDTHTIDLAAAIVAAYVSNNAVQAGDLPGLIASVHGALKTAAEPLAAAPAEDHTVSASAIRKSITPDYLVSFIDGKRYKTLRRHLGTHGLTPEQYREKYGLGMMYPMVAESYAAQRSELAKSIGLGNMRGEKHPKSAAYDGPKRPRGRPRKLSVVPATETATQAA